METREKAALFAVIGVALIVGAIALAVVRREFVAGAARAEGVVTRLNAGRNHVDVEFTTSSGERISYPENGGSYDVGDRVTVLYTPEDPRRTAEAEDSRGGSLLGWLGAGVLVVALMFAATDAKKRRP